MKTDKKNPNIHIKFTTPLFNRAFDIIFTEYEYTHTKKNASFLHTPRFTIKNLQGIVKDLTYRKINFWDNEKLIDCSRNKSNGWRKFSPYNVILIQIISHLKKLGFNHTALKQTILNIKDQNGKIPYKLEHFMFAYGVFHNKYLLIIDEFNNAVFCPESAYVEIFFKANLSSEPIIILPFFEYINKFNQKEINPNISSTIEGLTISKQENTILAIIKNKEFTKITIKKPNGKEYLIKTTSIQQGNFTTDDVVKSISNGDYQNITTHTTNGKIVSIVKEENIKV